MRRHNWETLLAEYLAQCQDKTMNWGTFDCCLFVADAVQVMTGNDYAQNYRGKYTTQIGAAKALKKYGRGDIKSTLNMLLGAAKAPLMASRGDVALVNTPDGEHAAAIVFNGIWGVAQEGLHQHSVNDIVCVWGIE